MKIIKSFCLILSVALMLGTVTSCQPLTDALSGNSTELKAQLASAEATINAERARATTLPANDPERVFWETKAKEYDKVKAQLDTYLANEDPLRTLLIAVPGYGGLLAALYGVLKQRGTIGDLKIAAVQLVHSLDAVMPVRTEAQKDVIAKIQNAPETPVIVDKAKAGTL